MGIEKVKKYFENEHINKKILEFNTSSATVELAAEAVGVEAARICKTLSFKIPEEKGCILIQTAGDSRIDNKKFRKYFGYKAKMLTPEEVIQYTGYSIGGVCAFGIERKDVEVYCDESLKRFQTVYPACGSSNSAVELTCEELFRFSHASCWIDVSKIPEPVLQ